MSLRLMQKQHWLVIFGLCMERKVQLPIVMERDDETSKVLCGMNYHKYSLDEDDPVTGLGREEIQIATMDYCVLRPYKDNSDKAFECLYGVVFSDWDVIYLRKTYQLCAKHNLL